MLRKLAALVVVALAGCGSIDVRGFVRDEDTGEPLPGATVRVGDEETQTDQGGFYELSVDDDDDTRRMYVSKSGYEARSESLEFDDDDEEFHKDFRLQKRD
jgi:uncharacterized membrane protein